MLENNVVRVHRSKRLRQDIIHGDSMTESDRPHNLNQKPTDLNIKELEEAKSKIRELEMRIKLLEGGNPRRFPDVKFLNYRTRKRILVCTLAFFSNLSSL